MNLMYRYSVVKFAKPSGSEYQKENEQYGVCARFLFTKQFVSNSVSTVAGLQKDGAPYNFQTMFLDEAIRVCKERAEYDTFVAFMRRRWGNIVSFFDLSEHVEYLSEQDIYVEKASNIIKNAETV